jgi:flagellar basal body L-ring protein FlgH
MNIVMQRYGSFFFVILFLVLMFLARMSETLHCEMKDSTTVSCIRTQEKIFYNSRKSYEINDLSSVQLIKRAIGSKHNVTAVDTQGKKIVLLSVPEKATDYAQEIIQKLKALPQSEDKSMEFTRNEMHSQLLLLSLAAVVILVCLTYIFKKKKPVR